MLIFIDDDRSCFNFDHIFIPAAANTRISRMPTEALPPVVVADRVIFMVAFAKNNLADPPVIPKLLSKTCRVRVPQPSRGVSEYIRFTAYLLCGSLTYMGIKLNSEYYNLSRGLRIRCVVRHTTQE